jgi:RNase H-fold protein (predicted Holliday junction resolvase)
MYHLRPMNKDKVKIMAICPSRYLGIAVLKDSELIYWGIKKVKGKGMSEKQVIEKAKKIIERLVIDYDPTVVVIEKPFSPQSRESIFLKSLITMIKELAKQRIRKIYFLSPIEVRSYISQGQKATKMKVAEIIATQYYPWL